MQREAKQKMIEQLTARYTPLAIKRGDVIAVKRIGGVYEHFAIYIGNGKVIHFADPNGDWRSPIIHEAPFENFLRSSKNFDVLNFDNIRKNPSRLLGSYGVSDTAFVEISKK